MAEPSVVELPDVVSRIGRLSDPLRFSEIRPLDAILPKAGNRYDVVGGKVLYAATGVATCFGETLARFRPTPRMRELLSDELETDETGFMVCGGVPQAWRLQRTVVTLSASDPLPFLNVDAPETQEYLSSEMAQQLVGLGYPDNLDISDIRNRDRRLSRAIAEWAYTSLDAEGRYRFSGIRYLSRIDTTWECWAIFDGTDIFETSRRSIELDDPDLQEIAQLWGLRAF